MTIKLGNAADIIAAAAPMLGFTPTNSIVVYMIGTDPDAGRIIKLALRFDVTIPAHAVSDLPRTTNLTAGQYNSAVLLAVCDPEFDQHAEDLLNAVRDTLTDTGIPTLRRLHTRDTTTQGVWIDLDTGQSGPTYPYTDSILTAQRVHDGTRISTSREDIVAEFDTTTPAPPVALGQDAALVLDTATEIADVIVGDRRPSATLATRAGILITAHPALRDAMLHLLLDHERSATSLWITIAAQLRGPARAEALTIAAAGHCLLNDAVRATIALDIAIAESTKAGHQPPTLAQLMLQALTAGLDPTIVRRIISDTRPA